MKKFLLALCVFMLLVGCAVPAYAVQGNVIYSGDSGSLIFAPGSSYSPTDLFPNFKDVMPGDSISQPITVRNDASNQVRVKIYIRALGAHPDSVDFLSRLHLRVEKSGDNDMGYMFDAPADQSAQLTEWVFLGTIYSGGEVNLDVILDVPVELDNRFQELVGYLDWEFMIEEEPIQPDDPKPPHTGDDSRMTLWFGLMVVSFLGIVILLLPKRRREEA